MVNRSPVRSFLLVALIAATATAAFVLRNLSGRAPAAVWRAEFFNDSGLQTEPVAARVYERAEFDWGDGAPHAGVAADGFSARLDSCLALERPVRVTFHLASDDGARLAIDGRPFLDNWGVHAWGTGSKGTILAAGRHHLRIEYFDAGADAALALTSNPPILEPPFAEAPTRPLDRTRPCSGP